MKRLKIEQIKPLIEKAINKNSKDYQDVKMYDSRKSIGNLISKFPMKNKVINHRLEVWEYGYDEEGLWWKYLYTIILKK
jgi:hypothetical protein